MQIAAVWKSQLDCVWSKSATQNCSFVTGVGFTSYIYAFLFPETAIALYPTHFSRLLQMTLALTHSRQHCYPNSISMRVSTHPFIDESCLRSIPTMRASSSHLTVIVFQPSDWLIFLFSVSFSLSKIMTSHSNLRFLSPFQRSQPTLLSPFKIVRWEVISQIDKPRESGSSAIWKRDLKRIFWALFEGNWIQK